MIEKKLYTVPEAARKAGVSADQLRCAIKDGMILGEFAEHLGDYMIPAPELESYLRRQKKSSTEIVAQRRKVLIIDDEINFANLLKLELQRDKRIEVKFATWGKDGILLAEIFAPDLILLDFMLPDTTGDHVLESLRKLRRTRNVKVVVYSAHTREAIRQSPNLEARLQSFGADDFLAKSDGTRPLLRKCYELLALDRETRRTTRRRLS